MHPGAANDHRDRLPGALGAGLGRRASQTGRFSDRFDYFQRVQPRQLSDRGVKVVARIVKRRAAAVGLDPERYAGHSLRAGLATSAAAGGASERVIMAQTGHRSADMVRRYIREGNLLQGEWTDLEEGGIPVVRPHGGRFRNDGAYRVMFDLGEDWDRQAEQFRHAKPAQRFDDPFDFKTTETSSGWRYTTYDITLHTVPFARPEPARCPTQSFSGTDSALLVLWWRAGAGAQRISACGPGSPGSRGRRQARRLQCPRWGCHQATPAIDPECQRELAAATGRVTSLFVEARPLQELWLAG